MALSLTNLGSHQSAIENDEPTAFQPFQQQHSSDYNYDPLEFSDSSDSDDDEIEDSHPLQDYTPEKVYRADLDIGANIEANQPTLQPKAQSSRMPDNLDPAGTAASIIKSVDEQSTSKAEKVYVPPAVLEIPPKNSVPPVHDPEIAENVHAALNDIAENNPPHSRTSPRRVKPTVKILDAVADAAISSGPKLKSGKGRAKVKLPIPDSAKPSKDGNFLVFPLHTQIFIKFALFP